MKIKLIIFDLDDTLYRERAFVESGFKAVARYLEKNFGINKKLFLGVCLNVLRKKGRGKIFDIALEKCNLYNKKLVNQCIKIYHGHKPAIRNYPGVVNLLTALKKKYKLALITDGPRSVQLNKIRALKIEEFFRLIICTDDYGHKKSKPHPYCFRRALKYFKVFPKETIYIGDNPHKDFIGARAAGITALRILRGEYKKLKPPADLDAHYRFKRFKEIFQIIKFIEAEEN